MLNVLEEEVRKEGRKEKRGVEENRRNEGRRREEEGEEGEVEEWRRQPREPEASFGGVGREYVGNNS